LALKTSLEVVNKYINSSFVPPNRWECRRLLTSVKKVQPCLSPEPKGLNTTALEGEMFV
jgi:hypothetical protein